ncbi:MAG: hypothetical protein R3C68_09015 [Myxococcota bacterium]
MGNSRFPACSLADEVEANVACIVDDVVCYAESRDIEGQRHTFVVNPTEPCFDIDSCHQQSQHPSSCNKVLYLQDCRHNEDRVTVDSGTL